MYDIIEAEGNYYTHDKYLLPFRTLRMHPLTEGRARMSVLHRPFYRLTEAGQGRGWARVFRTISTA